MCYQQNTTKVNGGKVTVYKRSDLGNSSWHDRFRFEPRDIRKIAKTTDLNEVTYIKPDSTGSAHKLSGLDDGRRPDQHLLESDKPPAEIIPYPDTRESA